MGVQAYEACMDCSQWSYDVALLIGVVVLAIVWLCSKR